MTITFNSLEELAEYVESEMLKRAAANEAMKEAARIDALLDAEVECLSTGREFEIDFEKVESFTYTNAQIAKLEAARAEAIKNMI